MPLPLVSVLAAVPMLTLEVCIDKAIARHPQVQMAALDQQASGAMVAVAQADRLPSVDLGSGYLFSSSRTGTTTDFIANNAPHETRGQILVRWQPDLGALGAALRRAEAERLAAEWSVKAVRRRLVYDVSTAYFAVLRADHARQALEDAVASSRRQVTATSAMVAAGKASRFDHLRTAAAAAAQEARLAAAQVDESQARRQLGLLIGDRVTGPVTEPPEPAGAATEPVAGTKTRAEVLAATALRDARQADLEAARFALWPQLTVSGAGGLDTGQVPGWNQLGLQAGLDLSWPVWDFGARQARVAAARFGAERAAAEVRLAEQTATADRIDAESQLNRATGQLAALKRASAAADAALAMARRGFAEGGVGSMDVLLAQQAAIEARLAMQAARYDYFSAVAFLRWATPSVE